GNMLPRDLEGDQAVSAEAIIKGDARSLSISAASIVAKTWRDRVMLSLAQQYPGYGWDGSNLPDYARSQSAAPTPSA
ncbi:MAG: hypothetical protein OQK68_03725, partial [Sedimenticola sp.]|nr:hypothetical protein [Sedimenticola sp.]